MRFAVPQFIDVEDKIFGPLTLKQGIYLAGSGGAAYLIYTLLGFFGLALIGIPLALVGVVFAFVKVNNQPFVSIASAAVLYTIKKKLYLWKKAPKKMTAADAAQAMVTEGQKVATPPLTQSRLRALAFSLDTEDGYASEGS